MDEGYEDGCNQERDLAQPLADAIEEALLYLAPLLQAGDPLAFDIRRILTQALSAWEAS